jgi:hypothetical protein
MASNGNGKKSLSRALSEIEKRLDADDILTVEEKEQIRAKAREEVRKRRRDKAEQELLQAAIREEERAFSPVDQWTDITIDLAPYAAYIALDGVQYFHGLTYTVAHGVAVTMLDICARTWEHQREIKGERRRGADLAWEGVRQGGVRITPSNQGQSPEALNTRASLLNSASI